MLPGLNARVVHACHTDGSIAPHLAEVAVLFTGGIAAEHEGRVTLGPFNTDREQARRSFRRLDGLDAGVVGFGHGQPLSGSATTAFKEATASATVLDPLG